MKYILFLFSIISTPLFAQNLGTNASDTMRTGPVLNLVQRMPKFKGDLNKYLSDNIRYPDAEKKAGTTGTVYVSFIVNKDGTISNVKILRGVVNGPGLDAESMRVVEAMPAWTPGVQNENPVRVQFNLPIHYKLADDNKSPQQQESGKF